MGMKELKFDHCDTKQKSEVHEISKRKIVASKMPKAKTLRLLSGHGTTEGLNKKSDRLRKEKQRSGRLSRD